MDSPKKVDQKAMTAQEKDWVDRQIARYPKTITPAQREELVAKFRPRFKWCGGPNLSAFERSVLGLD